MSYKIPLLGGTSSKPLDDSELTYILVMMCSQVWRVKYAKHAAGLQDEQTLDHSIKYLEALEHTSALVQASKPDDKRPKPSQDVKKTETKKTGKFLPKKEKFCQNCKNAGLPEWLYTNHNTKDCKRKDDNQGKNGKGCHQGYGEKYQQKMFALILEFQKKSNKKSKERSKKHQESSSDSESDSNSD